MAWRRRRVGTLALSGIGSLPASQWLFLALAGHVALLCGTAIHELGHGLTALLLGGSFKDIFVSSFGGEAGASAPGQRNVAVLAAGSLTEILAGLAAWGCLQRRRQSHRLTRRFDGLSVLLWLFATQTILASLTYISLAPAVQTIFGFASGDWPLLLDSKPRIRWALLAAGLVVVAPLSAVLMRAAPRALPPAVTGNGRAPELVAGHVMLNFVILLLPSRLLRIASGLVLLPWLDSSLLMLLGSTLHILFFAVPGALWIAWFARRAANTTGRPVERTAQTTASRVQQTPVMPVGYWNASLVAVACAFLVVFGPTDALRRGLALSPPHPDDYLGVAQRIRLQVTLVESTAPAVILCSRPVRDAGSRYRRRFTQALASQGPSLAGAQAVSAFIAHWNLGGGEAGDITPPRAIGDEWCWDFAVTATSSPMRVALWPVTWILESHIAELRVIGGRLTTANVHNLRLESRDPPVLAWSRPDGMTTVQRFEIFWP